VATIVRDNPTEHRYEIHDGDRLAGFSDYKLTQHRIAFTHTQVDREFNGRGLGRRLVTGELEDARRRGLAVLPFCPYVRKVIARDPARFLDLVPAKDRVRFQLPEAAEVDGPDVKPVKDT
jgi:uncharacterized protein